MKIPDAPAAEPEGSAFPDFSAMSAEPSAPVTGTGAVVARRERTAAASKPSGGWLQASGESASSDVSLVVSGAIGAVATVVTYALMFPLRNYLLGQLFWDRGFVPFVTTYLMYWSLAILVLKWLNLKAQKESMLLDVLPTEISDEITIKSLDKFVSHIRSLPGSSSRSFLINRLLRGIEHFRVRKSAAETVTMMESQSAIDANNVAGSYTILKVFIWSLPILGFIGTVIGVSAAVASLAASLESASDVSAMKGAMNQVFAGLGTAFDTTLLALIMSMLVKIPGSALQKSEEDMISSVDEYCNENFLRRLNDGREGGAERGSGGGNASVFREAVEAAMGTHHAELEKWLAKLDSLGGKLTTQMADGWEKTAARIQKQQQQHAASLQQQQLEQQQQLQQQQLEQQRELQAQLQQMATVAAGIQSALATVATEATTMQTQVNGSFSAAQEMLRERLTGIDQGLNSLSTVLVKLGEQGVVVQQVPAPAPAPAPVTYRRKRGWFGSFL